MSPFIASIAAGWVSAGLWPALSGSYVQEHKHPEVLGVFVFLDAAPTRRAKARLSQPPQVGVAS